MNTLECDMFTIGRLATAAGVTPDTLRFYERERLVSPAAKTPAGYRLYDAGSIRRVRFIRTAQHCGFSLAEIHELLKLRQDGEACCADVRSLAIQKKLRIEQKLRTLQAMSSALDDLIRGCEGDGSRTDDCAILNALESSLEATES